MKRQWKTIKGLPLGRYYEVSNFGQVRHIYRRSIMCSSLTNSGYERIILGSKIRGKVIWRYVHRLVAEAFIGNATGKDVNHLDGNKTNNIVSNLEVCTRSENNKHAYAVLGRKSHNIRLTKEIADEIRQRIQNGEVQNTLAKEYRVSPMVISRIRHFIQVEYR